MAALIGVTSFLPLGAGAPSFPLSTAASSGLGCREIALLRRCWLQGSKEAQLAVADRVGKGWPEANPSLGTRRGRSEGC